MNRLVLVLIVLLWMPTRAWAAVLTVGPNGTYPTLQAALNVAASNGDDDEIRLQAGQLQTTAQALLAENARLEIIGGWNASFSRGVQDPSATVLTGSQLQRVLALTITDGDVLVRNLTLADGAAENGAGADIVVAEQATFELAQCEVLGNTAFGASTGGGAGVRVTLTDSAVVEIDDCLFAQNQVQAATASGGGLLVVATDGNFTGRGLEFINNVAVGTGAARGGGLALDIGEDDPTAEFVRLSVSNNRVESNTSAAGAGMHLLSSASVSGPFVTLEAAEFIRNRRDGSAVGVAQLQIEPADGNLTLRSVAVLDGINSSGLRIDAVATAQVLVNNTTAAGNDGDGIRHEDGSSLLQTQYNAIAFGNGGADLVIGDDGNGEVRAFDNRSGVDPGFIDPTNGNYRLATGSSAIDSCINVPIGGIGNLDADFGDRTVGSVDCGAYEWSADNEDAIFDNGFETI